MLGDRTTRRSRAPRRPRALTLPTVRRRSWACRSAGPGRSPGGRIGLLPAAPTGLPRDAATSPSGSPPSSRSRSVSASTRRPSPCPGTSLGLGTLLWVDRRRRRGLALRRRRPRPDATARRPRLPARLRRHGRRAGAPDPGPRPAPDPAALPGQRHRHRSRSGCWPGCCWPGRRSTSTRDAPLAAGRAAPRTRSPTSCWSACSIRLVTTPGGRSRSFRLLVAGDGPLAVADTPPTRPGLQRLGRDAPRSTSSGCSPTPRSGPPRCTRRWCR